MMERNSNVIRSLAWMEIFPWLNIYKTFRLAIGFRALAMSALAILLTVTGWGIFGHVFSTKEPATAWLRPYADCPWREITRVVPDQPILLGDSSSVEHVPQPLTNEPVHNSWSFLSRPLLEGFALKATFGNVICLICCGLWSLATWAFFGAAITRIAVVQLAANERITWGAALRFSCSKFFAYFFAPLFPLGGIALAAVPVLLIGLLLRFGLGAFFAALLWPIFLISGLTIALLLLGLIFGWPLMWPTISTEGTDSFDALSRSYAYVFQRPLHYLFYIIVASILGLLGWIFVMNFAAAVVWTTYWAASWGAGAARIQEIMDMQTLSGDKLTGLGYAGAWLIHFWTGMAKLFAVGFGFSFFWNAYAAIYLLLRRDVDATEMDEVYLDADEGEAKFGLPNIVTDDAGAPVVEEKGRAAEEKAPEPTPPVDGGSSEEKPSSP